MARRCVGDCLVQQLEYKDVGKVHGLLVMLLVVQKENVQTIREAAMRGNLDRVEKLLDMGFSADAESVRASSFPQMT